MSTHFSASSSENTILAMQRASPWSLCNMGQRSKLYGCTCTLPPGPCRSTSAVAFLPWPRSKKLFYCRVYLFACLFFLFSFIFVFQGCPLLSLHTLQRAREREGDSERPFEGEMRIEMGCCWNVKERRWSKSICLWRHRTERTKNRSKMGEKRMKDGERSREQVCGREKADRDAKMKE